MERSTESEAKKQTNKLNMLKQDPDLGILNCLYMWYTWIEYMNVSINPNGKCDNFSTKKAKNVVKMQCTLRLMHNEFQDGEEYIEWNKTKEKKKANMEIENTLNDRQFNLCTKSMEVSSS